MVLDGNQYCTYVKTKQIIDITMLIPLWVTYHGWINGLNDIQAGAASQKNWMGSLIFPDHITRPIRTRLDEETVACWSNNIMQQRHATLNIMDGIQPDIYQQLKNVYGKPNAYANEYDSVNGHQTYIHLYKQYHYRWDQQQRITTSISKPIFQHLAFPPTAQRVVTSYEPNQAARHTWKKDSLLSDFAATIRPIKLHRLDKVDTFNEPFIGDSLVLGTGPERRSRLCQSSHMYHEEIDTILDFVVAEALNENLNSTPLDPDCHHEPVLDEVEQLLINLDLQQDEMNRIINNFANAGIAIKDVISTLFDIKPHDRDLLLNRILHLNNTFVEKLRFVRPTDKQLINQFIIDLVALFDCQKIRKQKSGPTHWLNNSHSIKNYTAIIQNKIATDMEMANRLKHTTPLTVNRDNPSSLVQEMSRVYDLYVLSSSYLLRQRQLNAEFFTKLVHDVANRRVEADLPRSLLNYTITRHATRGNLVNILPQKKLKLEPGGAIASVPYTPQWKSTIPPRNQILANSDNQLDETIGPNDLESTFDRHLESQN